MVLPLIPVALGVAALLGVGSVGYLAYKEFWAGKQIAVLGGRGVGKTTFINYLKTKSINSNYEQTDLEKYSAMKVEIDGISLRIASGYDVGGGAVHHREWQTQIDEADIVFYLMDISRILEKDKKYIENTKIDINAIKAEIEKRQKDIRVFLIASHADKHNEYFINPTKFEEKVNKNQLVERAVMEFGGTDHCRVIIGSLRNEQNAESLVKKILTSVEKGK